MRKLLIIYILVCNSLYAQVPLKHLFLAYSGKVWGFCKYFHPTVRSGIYNWDQALLNVLPVVDTTSSFESFNKSMITCLHSIDSRFQKSQFQSDNLRSIELDWIRNQHVFSIQSIDILSAIELSHRQERNYYANTKDDFRIDFSNEKQLEGYDVRNKYHRLLELFRFWNCVEYFSPNKNCAKTNWDSVLLEMLPKYYRFSDPMSQTLNTLELISSTNDGHSCYIPRLLENHVFHNLAPIRTSRIDNKVVVTKYFNKKYAQKNDIRLGDIITKISGISIDTIIQRIWNYVPSSNSVAKYRDAQFYFLNTTEDSMLIEFQRNEETLLKYVQTYRISDSDFFDTNVDSSWKSINNNIGYINLGLLEVSEIETAFCELGDKKGIIVDARYYPKGTSVEITKFLLTHPTKIIKLKTPKLEAPGHYQWTDYEILGPFSTHCKFSGMLVVLVDEWTQSQGEWAVMEFQAYKNCLVIGSQTAGTDGHISKIILPNGDVTGISGIGVYYPDNFNTQVNGVKIDQYVRKTVDGIRAGRDEQLEYGIRLIEEAN